MNFKKYIIAITIISLLLIIPTVKAESLTLVNDNGLDFFFTNPYGWSLHDESIIKKVGQLSLKIEIPTTSQYQSITGVPQTNNFTAYSNFNMWIYGNGTSFDLRISFFTNDDNFYYFFIDDSTLGWRWLTEQFSTMSSYGSPSWSNINKIGISLSDDNGETPITIYIDYLIVSDSFVNPNPTTITPITNLTDLVSMGIIILMLMVNFLLILKPVKNKLVSIIFGLFSILFVVSFLSSLPFSPWFATFNIFIALLSMVAGFVRTKQR